MSVLFNNPLLGAAGQGPSADLGDTIAQSLRFSGSKLTGSTVSTSTWTCSFWIKFAVGDGSGYIFSAGNDAGVSTNGNQLYMNNDAESVRGRLSFDNGIEMATRRLRDPSAWYHIVGNYNGSVLNYWVNNESLDTLSGVAGTGHSGTFVIGGTPNTPVASCWDAIYLAEFNYLDGTVLTPSSFGRTNDDGVWVPESLSSLTSDQYGADGFRLQFNDSSNLGDDSAPTGGNHSSANDFTASGFDTSLVGIFSANLVSSSGTWASGRLPAQLFDTSTSTMAQVGATGATMTFTPTTPINYQSLHYFNHGATWNLNSGTTGGTAGSAGWQEIDGSSGTLTSLQFLNSGGGAAAVGAIAINGTATANILVDNTDNDVDFFDTPTNNYAVLNPLNIFDASVTYSKANLRANYGGGGNRVVFVDMPMDDGKYYWECTLKDQVEAWVGVITEDYEKRQVTVFSDNSDGWSYNMSGSTDNQKNHNGSNSSSHGATVAGDTIGFLLDIPSGTLKIEINGATQSNSEFTNIPTNKRLFVAFNIGGGSGNVNMDWNFGQMPFLFEPTGYQHVATNSLPEPTIKNGKDHFEAITWTGDGNDNRDITTTESFQPDFVWIKRRGSTLDHGLFDSVRGGNKILYSNLTIAEDTSSVNIKQFNSDGFRLGTGAQVNASSETYVAWCWKAGGTAVSNTDGTITSSVSANTDAGFSIVSYTGNSTLGATIGHGLSSAPEWILTKNRDTAADWAVYHVNQDATAPEDKYMALNTTDGTATAVDRWNNTAPTSTVFTVGDAVQTNGANDMIAYCWHSVPGYSAFGSYTGNNSTDGVFIHTGMKPAWILIKRVNNADHWAVYDTTRDVNNPAFQILRPDVANAEDTTQPNNDLDILSNGFKWRTNDSRYNASEQYVYACFAEHPFGGENAPPATAR
jgi:hypothetical protein